MVRYDKSTADRGSRYVEDRRDGRRRSGGGGGGFGGGKSVGLGGLLIALVLGVLGFGDVFGGSGGFQLDNQAFPESSAGSVGAGTGSQIVDPESDSTDYMKFLMIDIQETWDEYFERAGINYQPTSLVIFDDVVATGCGQATSAVGPFYCPAPGDNKVYVDFAFFDELASPRFGASGDFAQAYVIAHEVGHHLQSILGISDAVRQAQNNDPGNKNEYSIRQELQADCFAGVWAYSANRRLTEETGQPIIEPGDIEEGLTAAAAVGDDRIQAQAGMTVNPHTWTHGSAAQRMTWFRVGFDNGDPELCDTFAGDA